MSKSTTSPARTIRSQQRTTDGNRRPARVDRVNREDVDDMIAQLEEANIVAGFTLSPRHYGR